MFDMFSNLAKAVVNTATLPVAVVADVITFGGSFTDKDKPYTVTQAEEVYKNLTEAGK